MLRILQGRQSLEQLGKEVRVVREFEEVSISEDRWTLPSEGEPGVRVPLGIELERQAEKVL